MKDTGFDPGQALREANAALKKARGVLLRFTGQLLVLWGLVYLVMYGGGELGWVPAWFWLPLDAAAFALSFALGYRVGEAFRTPEGSRLQRIWVWFGATMALAVFAFAARGMAEPAFSFTLNLLVGYALIQSGEAVRQPGLVRGGLLLAIVNTLFYVFWPDAYAFALAAMGALACAAGLRQVR